MVDGKKDGGTSVHVPTDINTLAIRAWSQYFVHGTVVNHKCWTVLLDEPVDNLLV